MMTNIELSVLTRLSRALDNATPAARAFFEGYAQCMVDMTETPVENKEREADQKKSA